MYFADRFASNFSQTKNIKAQHISEKQSSILNIF